MASLDGDLQKMQIDAEARVREYQKLRTDIESMRVTARSDDKSITVTVGPGGSLVDLQLTNQALRHGPNTLARLILSTIAAANADVAQQMAECVSALTGPKIDVMGLVRAQLPDLMVNSDEGKGP